MERASEVIELYEDWPHGSEVIPAVQPGVLIKWCLDFAGLDKGTSTISNRNAGCSDDSVVQLSFEHVLYLLGDISHQAVLIVEDSTSKLGE